MAHAAPGKLKPYVLGNPLVGDMNQVVSQTKAALTANGFEVVGSYSPYPAATVIVATNAELKAAASKAMNGGFGVAERVAVTSVEGKLQVSYVNPNYIGAAYGLGNLDAVYAKLRTALGDTLSFGSEEGMTAKQLAPGTYHYKMGMPYFNQTDLVGRHPDYKTAVDTVEKNLAQGLGGTKKVYRIDLPNEVSVFGIGIVTGDGLTNGAKDTDKEVMDIIDYKDYRSTAYLPYELMIKNNKIIALRGRYRIAVHFPDTSMMGEHGFTKIMSSPGGIRRALETVAGGT
jgi:hypothetical protein